MNADARPLLELAGRLHKVMADVQARRVAQQLPDSPALTTIAELLGELALVELGARWGVIFALRDRLRDQMAAGEMGPELDQLDHLEWSMLWALVDELDRLEETQ